MRDQQMKAVQGYVTTTKQELDTALGGGIPVPSVALIEGNNNSGKTVLSQQFLYGALSQGYGVTVITTENTPRGYLAQMDLLHADVRQPFIRGTLRIVPIHVKNIVWTEYRLSRLLSTLTGFIANEKSRVIIIDSLTYLCAEASLDDILTFFSRVRKLAEPNYYEMSKAFICTIHGDFHGNNSEQLLIRIRSLCDVHIELNKEVAQGQVVRSIEVPKLKGSKLMANKVTRFEVHPAFGIRVVSTSEAMG